jgi:hypothetical protein
MFVAFNDTAGASQVVCHVEASASGRGPSIPGYPSLTVGYPTEFQNGGIDIPLAPGVKMMGASSLLQVTGLGSCRKWPAIIMMGAAVRPRQVQLSLILLVGMHWHQVRSRHILISVRQTHGQVLMGPEAQVAESTICLQVVPCVPHTQGPAGGLEPHRHTSTCHAGACELDLPARRLEHRRCRRRSQHRYRGDCEAPHSMRETGEPSASYLKHLLLKCTTS